MHRAIRRHMGKVVVAIASATGAAYADSASATADSAFAADTRGGTVRALAPCDVEYSPSWGGVTNEGAYVVIERVVNVGMPNVSTSVVATCAADAEGECTYAVAAGDERCIRLIHRVYSSQGTEIGEPLVRDVAFGYQSAEGAEFAADCRTNSLQEVVRGCSSVNLSYSTAWAANAAAASIKAVKLSGKGGVPMVTNDLFSAVADAEGVDVMRDVGIGWWRLLFQSSDVSGNVLLEYLTDEFRMSGGLAIIVW